MEDQIKPLNYVDLLNLRNEQFYLEVKLGAMICIACKVFGDSQSRPKITFFFLPHTYSSNFF